MNKQPCENSIMADNREKLLSDGLLIAGMPLLGYAIAFAYETGYGFYNGIPLELLSLSLTQVLVAIAVLSFILIILANISWIWAVSLYGKKERSPVVAVLWRQGPLFLFWLPILLVFSLREWGVLLAIVIFSTVSDFIWPLFTQKDKATYTEKLRASEEEPDIGILIPQVMAIKAYGNDVTGLLRLFRLLKCGFFVLFLVWLAYCAGRGEALWQTSYFTDSVTKNVVLLRFYGDTVVAHEYDPNTHKLTGDFIITKISSKQQLRFEKKPLGHLEKPSP